MEFVEIGIYLIGISFVSAVIEVVNITSASQLKEPKILKFKVWYFNLVIKARNYIYWSLKLTFLFSNQYVFLFNFRYLWIEAWDCLDCWVVFLNYFSIEIIFFKFFLNFNFNFFFKESIEILLAPKMGIDKILTFNF